jgi:hypothetical protein
MKKRLRARAAIHGEQKTKFAHICEPYYLGPGNRISWKLYTNPEAHIPELKAKG